MKHKTRSNKKAAQRGRTVGPGDTQARASCPPYNTTKTPKNQTADLVITQCEECKEIERTPMREQARRLALFGRVLCHSCAYPMITAAIGGPCYWAATDAVLGFLKELRTEGLVKEHDKEVWACLRRAFDRVGQADYIKTPEDLAAWGRF